MYIDLANKAGVFAMNIVIFVALGIGYGGVVTAEALRGRGGTSGSCDRGESSACIPGAKAPTVFYEVPLRRSLAGICYVLVGMVGCIALGWLRAQSTAWYCFVTLVSMIAGCLIGRFFAKASCIKPNGGVV